MKLIASFMILLAAIFLVAAPGTAANIIVNPGIENSASDIAPWAPDSAIPGIGAYTVDTTTAHSGTNSVKYTGGTVTGVNRIYQTIPLQPNTTYNLSFWYKTAWLSAAAAQVLFEVNVGTATYTFDGSDVNLSASADWKQVNYIFTTPAGATSGGPKIANFTNKVNSRIWFDDFSLTVPPPPPPLNLDFEAGTLPQWTQGDFPLNVIYSVTDVNPHGGTYCAVGTGMINGGEFGSAVSMTSGKITTIPSKNYLVSFWYRTEGTKWEIPGDYDVVDVSLIQNPAGSSSRLDLITAYSADWKKIVCPITMSASTTSVNLNLNSHLMPGEKLFIDDVEVAEMITPTDENWGFEWGVLQPWSYGVYYPQHTSYEVTSSVFHSGKYAAVGTAGAGNPPSGEHAPTPLFQYNTLLPDTDYLFSFWYKTSGWSDEIPANYGIVDVRFWNNMEPYAHVGNLGASKDWTKATYLYHTLPGTNLGGPNLSCYQGVQGMKIYYDDFVVKPVVYDNYASVGALTKNGDMTFGIVDAVVTRAPGDSMFFVESADRSAGMLVESPDFPMAWIPNPGDVVHLKGVYKQAYDTALFNQMLTFQTSETPTIVRSVTPLKPLVTIQRPLLATLGLTLDGLLVKADGIVSNADEGAGVFEINDGSGSSIRVFQTFDYPFPANGQTVAVTGNVVSHNGVRYIYILTYGQVDLNP